MKKITKIMTLFAVILMVSSTTAFAQSPIAKGQTQLNLGVGFSNWGLPVYIGSDHGIHPDITLGGELSYRAYHERYNGNNKYRHSIFGLSANANYHFNRIFNISPTWDLYAGLNLGFYHWNSSSDYPGSGFPGLGLGGQIGGRYYFSDKLGVNLEFGGGNAFSGGKFGISVKL